MFQNSRPRLIMCVSYCIRLAGVSPGDSVTVCSSSANVNNTSLFKRLSSARKSASLTPNHAAPLPQPNPLYFHSPLTLHPIYLYLRQRQRH
jgi:hypothetical protein